MKSKIFVVAVLVVCMCSLASANKPAHKIVTNVQQGGNSSRVTGTVGNVSVSLMATGALAGDVTVAWDTTPTTAYYSLYQSYDAFLVYGQIYDYPWIGVCHTSTSSASCNDFISGSTVFNSGNDPSHHYSETFSFTVPAADTYQGWGIVYGGWYPGVPWNTANNSGFWITTYNYSFASGNTAAITADTPTPDPNAGGTPIPTLNWLGILAMIAMMAGVAMLLVIRRK